MTFSWLHPKRVPLIVAHRGASAVAPENTLAAFRQALHDGADAIELDVRLTKDREIIVFHDRTLDRTTDGHGHVHDRTLTDLKRLSAGRWFGPEFAAERIPTLAEVFELLPLSVGINVEVKIDQHQHRRFDFVDAWCSFINLYRADRRTLVSSFSHNLVRQVKEVTPQIATALLYHPIRHAAKSPVVLAQAVGADYLILSSRQLRKATIDKAHTRKLRVAAYTINERRQLDRVLPTGLDALITDQPASIRKFVSSADK